MRERRKEQMSDQLQHLWIPDEEVEQLDKKARPPIKDYRLDHSQHGAVLSSGLQNVMTAYSHLKRRRSGHL